MRVRVATSRSRAIGAVFALTKNGVLGTKARLRGGVEASLTGGIKATLLLRCTKTPLLLRCTKGTDRLMGCTKGTLMVVLLLVLLMRGTKGTLMVVLLLLVLLLLVVVLLLRVLLVVVLRLATRWRYQLKHGVVTKRILSKVAIHSCFVTSKGTVDPRDHAALIPL
jgi:hypothetical protein